MTSDSTVVSLRKPETLEDPPAATLRSGVRRYQACLLAPPDHPRSDPYSVSNIGQFVPSILCSYGKMP